MPSVSAAGAPDGPPSAGVTGVILAGGRGKRMAGVDKGLVRFAGKPMLEHVLDALVPQVDRILISANRNLASYAAYGYPVIPDHAVSGAGPLAGMLNVMNVADTASVLCVPCDAPHLPNDLAMRLSRRMSQQDADVCVPHDGHRLHHVFALLRTRLAGDLRVYLERGEREVAQWMRDKKLAMVDFSDRPACFANVNTARDLFVLERARQGCPVW